MVDNELSLNHLYHELQRPALLTLLVETVGRVLEKKLVRFEVNDSVVHGLQLLDLVAILVLANRLKLQTFLPLERQLDGRLPPHFSGLHVAILECLVGFFGVRVVNYL